MTIRSQGLFGVGLFLLGASLASSSFSIISVVTMVPALVLFEFAFLGDLAVSIMAITASKKYGKKSLIFSTVLSGINTLLRAFAFTLLLFYLFAGPLGLPTASTRTNKPNEDEIRTQYDLPSDEFPSFAPGSDRPPRPHGPGGPGQRPPRPHGPGGPGGPGDCPPLPADLPPLPGPGELPPLPGDLPPFPGGPGGPGRPGHCGPGFPGGPGRPGHHGHPGGHGGQDPRDNNNEQHPRQGDNEQQQGEHQGPRRGREENEDGQQPREHQGPRHGQDVNEQDDNQRESDSQNARAQQTRKRNPSPMEISAPFIAWGISMWSFGLNLAIFVLSIVHTRRLFLEGKTGTSNTTTVNGKVYSELSSKV